LGSRILIVDDEKNIVEILRFNLEREGYVTRAAYDGREALRAAEDEQPDLILLDVMLPYTDGFEVCRRIRQSNKLVPIIMLTAREEENDMVLGLELGADDYITKPFSVRELLARVRTNIRRQSVKDVSNGDGELLRAGLITVDVKRQRVMKSDTVLELTQREYELIRFMIASPGKVFSREELLSGVWQYEYFGDLRAVDVAIRRLREKLEDDPAVPAILMTKRGAGYYLEA
jgi:two-component system response regulator VicR